MPGRHELHLDVTHGIATVNGEASPIEQGASPAAALLEHAKRVAASSGDLLAHVTDSDGTDVWLDVLRDGTITQTAPPTPHTDPNPLSRWETTAPSRRTAPPAMPNRRSVILGLGATAGLLSLAGIVAVLNNRDHPSPTPANSPRPAPVVELPSGQPAPAGWVQHALWSVPYIADPLPDLALHDQRAFILTQPPGVAVRRLQAFSTKTGALQWHADLPRTETVMKGPIIATLAGVPAVVVGTDRAVRSWRVDTGRTHLSLPLPSEESRLIANTTGAWLTEQSQQRYDTLTADGLRRIVLPDKTTPFAVTSEGLLAIDDKAHVSIFPAGFKKGDRAPATHTLERVDKASPGTILAVTQELALVSWQYFERVRVRAYHRSSWKPAWTTSTQLKWSPNLGNTLVSPDQTWAIIDNRHVDLSDGTTTTVLPAWTPLAITDNHAWGSDGTFTLTATRQGKLLTTQPTTPKTQTLAPVGGTKTVAFMAGGSVGDIALFAIPSQ